MLDITITATVRPDLFHQTLKSFTDKLFINRKEYRIVVNIDPIGEDVDPMRMVEVARQFFDNVLFNIPDEPNFAKAVKWCWENIESKFVFHLEDDWVICKKVNINSMIELLNENQTLSSLRLSRKRLTPECNFYGFRIRKKVGLNPTLWRSEILRDISQGMNDRDNPEKQLKTLYRKRKEDGFMSGVYFEKDIVGKYVKDIGGRSWMENSNLHKRKGSNFVTWGRL